ncbi:hypothetical protein AB0K60_08950 [Thermopolyspora sp. NPDC052614]|uniref:hypothetical protein n=1 Tax=Thermopolyspora sp. NPDC052614 TaxID=3155682 RepID=UPI0034496962
MRRALGYVTIWCGATVLAISLAWFGVRDVLRAEVTDEPYPGVAIAVARTGRPPDPAPATTPATPTPGSTPTPTSDSSATPARKATGRPAGPSAAPVTTRPPATSAARPSPTRKPTASRVPRKPTTSPKPSHTTTTSAPEQSGQVKVVTVKGGQVSFATDNNECRLLSATPAAGYEAKVSGNVGWIRVDLIQGEHGSSVFCTWHNQVPMTDTWEF